MLNRPTEDPAEVIAPQRLFLDASRETCSRLSALRARSAQGVRPNYGNPESVTRHDKMARPGKEPSE
jgi:hypothetical protein